MVAEPIFYGGYEGGPPQSYSDKMIGFVGYTPKTNMSPEKGTISREYIFQPLIFKGHVSFSGEYGFRNI